MKNETNNKRHQEKISTKILLTKDFKAKMVYTQTQKDNHLGC
ncbi:hypothetical protein hp908_1528 [Helicobacter pylori 908]|nr:hypothetical protein hp908_1528 [Helicobacter pylori 908]ADZ50592.1 hypothetical protein hp2017_1468 [Helicobacter pylori 2017]ADZ52197.1 hypothetical protein hp2018_1473 [Helicobacter pylori 2018]